MKLTHIGLALALPLAAQAQDMSGETITIVVPNPAGSGGDLHGRLFARYFAQNIPGEPTVIVVNRTGGGGNAALNFVYETGESDGTLLCYCGFNAAAVLSEAPGIRFVPEEMAHIGTGVTNLAFVARRDAVSEASDLTGGDALLIGGRGPGNTMDTFGNLGLEVMQADYRYIGGFGGFSKISAAMLADEVQAGHAGLSGFLALWGEDSEVAAPVYYHPFFDTAGDITPPREGTWADGVPSIVEAHEAVHGAPPEGRWWDAYVWFRTNVMSATIAVTGPPNLDEGLEEMFQEAFQATVSDPDYIAEYEATIGPVPSYNNIETTEAIFSGFRDVPDAVQAALDEIVSR